MSDDDLLLRNVKFRWRCNLCVSGWCYDDECRGGRQCQAWFCMPPPSAKPRHEADEEEWKRRRRFVKILRRTVPP
jgi:hypothetical protein